MVECSPSPFPFDVGITWSTSAADAVSESSQFYPKAGLEVAQRELLAVRTVYGECTGFTAFSGTVSFMLRSFLKVGAGPEIGLVG